MMEPQDAKHPSGKIGPHIWDEMKAEFKTDQISGVAVDHARGVMTFTDPGPEGAENRSVGISAADRARAVKVLQSHKP